MKPLAEAKRFLKRLQAGLAFFKSVPKDRVNLAVYAAPGNPPEDSESYSDQQREDIRKFCSAKGVEETPCGTIGCLAGWLNAMPAYKAWVKREHSNVDMKTRTYVSTDLLKEYFGMGENLFECGPFDSRTKGERRGDLQPLSDKQIAIRRMQGEIKRRKEIIKELAKGAA